MRIKSIFDKRNERTDKTISPLRWLKSWQSEIKDNYDKLFQDLEDDYDFWFIT